MFKLMNSLVAPPFETLVWLGRNPRQSYYVRELAKVLSISTGAASGQLRMLDEQGLITSEQKGRTLLYRANISHPVVREVKILATLLELSPLIASLANSAERMILFGSCASGEDAAESDIDLFIETADRTAVANRISQSENQDLRKLSLIIMTAGESLQLRTRDRPLFDRIRRGRYLIGEEL
ncbi:nucleotidyltransferase domain-containing protein [Methanoregula sp.]|uniref:nucleotidyltransferase domain-containing protein n=1 Tax=Methanoregula sp. TaxID=2052170 RepID=UPI003C789E03